MDKQTPPSALPYDRWIHRYDTLSAGDRSQILSHIAVMPKHPLISIVMPVYETPEHLLREAIASVQGQLFSNWQLCIADDASPTPRVAQVLTEAAAADPRVCWIRRTENGHISAASNTALTLAKGEFVALMDHDDTLPAHALYEVAAEINAHPDVDVIYSDEDRIDADGVRSNPYFKPMWSPELLCGHNMISHLGVYRRALLEAIGGFRLGYEGSQDWDLALRATAATQPDRIRHIPAILYHWRWNSGTLSFSESLLERCKDAGLRAVQDWLHSSGIEGATVEPSRLTPGWTRVSYPLPRDLPRVSVVIPTRNRANLLRLAAEGVLTMTNWPHDKLELVIADNGSTEQDAQHLLRSLSHDTRVQVLDVPGPFNFANMNNRAVRQSCGEIVVLLNNDIEVQDPDWLSEMARLALQREIGAVGAKLVYPDGRVQHGGVATGPDGIAAHILSLLDRDNPGYFGQLGLTRSLSAVTAACMATRRAIYDEVGGLDEDFAVAFNDVDFCLRLQDFGYRVVWTPDAVLVHHESATRSADYHSGRLPEAQHEWQKLKRRWGSTLDQDPYHNPNVLLHDGGGPCFPAASRRSKPWQPFAQAAE